jgi:hypothetical protein
MLVWLLILCSCPSGLSGGAIFGIIVLVIVIVVVLVVVCGPPGVLFSILSSLFLVSTWLLAS